jgi:hypothetical protein
MNVKSIVALIAVMSASIYAANIQPDKALNIALIVDKASGLDKSPLISLLEVQLSQEKGIKLLERAEIEKILSEKKLQLSFEASANADRLKIGNILGADALLCVDKIVTTERQELIHIRIIETRTGIILDDVLITSSGVEADVKALIEGLRPKLLKLSVPLNQRLYLGISDIRNEEPGSELNPVASALTQLLKYDLNVSKNIVILEREQLNYLLKERNLAGTDVQLRASSIMLEGGIRRIGSTKEYSISLRLIELSGKKTKSTSLNVPSADMTVIRQKICQAVISALGETSEFSISGDSHVEAAYFLKRAESSCTDYVLHLNNDSNIVASFAETALALDENNINLRNTVFHCLRDIAWSGNSLSVIDDLKVQKRAHEIDLGTVERYARLGTQYIPDQTFDYLFTVYLYDYTGSVKPSEKEKSELLSEIHDICVKKYDILYELFLKENKSPIVLFAKRTRDSYAINDTSDQFCQNVKSFVLEYEKYQSKISIGFYEILADTLNPERFRERKEEILPLLEWLRSRPDPTLKMLSYYAMVHPEIDNNDAAVKVCDLLFLEGATDIREGVASWRAAIKLDITGQLENYFENILKLAENGQKASIFNNPKAVQEFVFRAKKDKQVEWSRRILSLLNTYQIPRTKGIDELKDALNRTLGKKDKTDNNNIGLWVNYTITPIPITSRDKINQYPEWVHIDKNNQKIIVVWRSEPKQQVKGEPLFDYSVTSMDIKGVPLKQIGKIENQEGLSIKCSENSFDSIFLGTADRGLIMIGPDGIKTFGEAQGCPSNNILSMAYLDNNLYLGFYGSLAKFYPKTKTFDILASRKAVQIKNDLEGGDIYWIGSMIADTKYNSLWFTLFADLKRQGIWKYNPTTGKFNSVHHPYGNRLFFNDNGEIIFTIGSQLNVLNPQTSEIRRLQGYSSEAEEGLRGFEISTHCVMIGKDILQPNGKLFSDDGKVYNLGKSWLRLERFGSGAIAITYGPYFGTNLYLSLIQPKESVKNNSEPNAVQ